MENWRCWTVGLLVALALGGIAPAQAFDIRDVQYFRANGYRSCEQCDLSGADLQGADLSETDLQGANLYGTQLQGANLSGANLQDTSLFSAYLRDANLYKAQFQSVSLFAVNLEGADLREANLEGADLRMTYLRGADLREANLQSANLSGADLQGVNLFNVDLQGIDLSRASLRGADLSEANLQGASLFKSQLQGADLRGTKVANTQLARVDLTGAIYAPASPPPNSYVAGILGLASVAVPTFGDITGLIQLRKLLQESGLPEEREATYAIEHSKTDRLLFADQDDPARGHLRWEEPLALAEGAFRWLAFEWPVGYGLYPGYALRVLAGIIMVFGLVYAVALATETGSLYRVWPAGRIEPLPDGLADKARLEPLRLWGRPVAALGRGLQFSLFSAFHLGFRELNVGTWLARVQAREYGLQAVGWVRVVAGVQSLLSVYLLAMWLLTYFGRPFG